MANHRTGNSLSAADQLSDKVFSNDLVSSLNNWVFVH